MKPRADHIELRKVADNLSKEDKDLLVKTERCYDRGRETCYKDIVTTIWESFINGEWRREKPDRPGLYPVANNQRNMVGEAKFVEENGTVRPVEEKWTMGSYWFWSVPRPTNMPVRPPEREDNTKEARVKGRKIPWLRVVLDEAVNS